MDTMYDSRSGYSHVGCFSVRLRCSIFENKYNVRCNVQFSKRFQCKHRRSIMDVLLTSLQAELPEATTTNYPPDTYLVVASKSMQSNHMLVAIKACIDRFCTRHHLSDMNVNKLADMITDELRTSPQFSRDAWIYSSAKHGLSCALDMKHLVDSVSETYLEY